MEVLFKRRTEITLDELCFCAIDYIPPMEDDFTHQGTFLGVGTESETNKGVTKHYSVILISNVHGMVEKVLPEHVKFI